MRKSNTRRRFLAVTGVGAGTILTGCLGGAGDESTQTTTEPPDEETQTPTEEPDPTTEEDTTPSEPESMSTVFHYSSPDESSQQHAVANVANLLETDLNLEDVVLVANGRGIRLLTSEESAVASKVKTLIDEGASFRACENSMSALDVTESDLIEGVETVSAGVGELTKLQSQGYAYIETP
ncbi:DsrE family protein [Haloferax sp. KTX1]|uniref:DsrE family protein n=1 Tax=Haloferax sp. KTX1 TaxID=2600597 RepID=UPI0011DE2A3A|nr:DsrE family protein [Haloferax sp. KTX1]